MLYDLALRVACMCFADVLMRSVHRSASNVCMILTSCNIDDVYAWLAGCQKCAIDHAPRQLAHDAGQHYYISIDSQAGQVLPASLVVQQGLSWMLTLPSTAPHSCHPHAKWLEPAYVQRLGVRTR